MPTIGREFIDCKAVRGGSCEYTSIVVVEEANASNTANNVIGQRDSISMVFDNDVILDDITIRNPGSTVTFQVSLIYSTGNTIQLSGPTTDFSINRPGDPSNVWYRVPRWSRIKVSIDPNSFNGTLQISAIGRG